MRSRVEEAIVSSGLIHVGDHILVAVSGGADSMALLGALAALAPELEITLSVGHFDHRLREGSAGDRAAVEALCGLLGVECYAGADDVAERARESGDTIEESARRHRYQFLEETASRIGATRIATGHTRDDQTETVLMRVIRGAGVRGLSGIPRRRGRVVRPILDVARADTVAWCLDNGVAFVDDPSNEDMRFTRNRIRHDVLPKLRSFFPDIDANLLRLGHNAADAVAHVRRVTTPLVDRAARRESQDVWVVDTVMIEHLDELSRHIFFADLLIEHLGCECEAGRVHYEHLDAMSRPGFPSGRMLSLPGITVRREHDALVFFRGVAHPDELALDIPAQEIALPGKTRVDGVEVDIAVLPRDETPNVRSREIAGDETGGGTRACVAYFALESLQPPLVIRTPQPGDRMRPFGMTGRKKLSDILVDDKIASRERATALVIADQAGIVWLVGVATSEMARVTGDTGSVVRITVSRPATG